LEKWLSYMYLIPLLPFNFRNLSVRLSEQVYLTPALLISALKQPP
jgi:hypothetical protein